MRRRNPDKGLKLVGEATAKESGAKYFLAMLKYRCNRVDPEAMALLHEISNGLSPLTDGGRTTTCGGCATSSTGFSAKLCHGTGFVTTTATFHCYPSRIPMSAFGQWDVGATGRRPHRSSTTAASSVTFVMSWTSGRVTSVSPWSKPSA
jgi:hypothetical protein